MTATRTLRIRLFGWLLLGLSASAQFAPASAKTPPRETQQTTCEEAELRPGYWNGNGIMPAVSVQKGMIGAVYSVPDDHPIAFTHLYIPSDRFARSVVDGHWIFLAEGKGQLGIWTSCRGEPYEDEMASSELRFMARKTAYLVVAGRAEEQTFEGFMSKLKHMEVSFSEERLSLEVDGEPFVVFRGVDDWTQYLE